MSYVKTDEHRKRLSESMQRTWTKRKEVRRERAGRRSARIFAETQLEEFDQLPQELRIQQFMGIISTIMKHDGGAA